MPAAHPSIGSPAAPASAQAGDSLYGIVKAAGPYSAWRLRSGHWQCEGTGGNERAMMKQYPNFVIRKTSLGPPARPEKEHDHAQ